ncbi:unnamed protein product [Pleuronectes platessa]|uniref:Uncharacterized protein n=1 Tax=Pleuronectes platessa TaxID=8262 RepID=A0A9N7TIJ5_PLEPL|nr:unnamed protein product [Pleuronectes platessa]
MAFWLPGSQCSALIQSPASATTGGNHVVQPPPCNTSLDTEGSRGETICRRSEARSVAEAGDTSKGGGVREVREVREDTNHPALCLPVSHFYSGPAGSQWLSESLGCCSPAFISPLGSTGLQNALCQCCL